MITSILFIIFFALAVFYSRFLMKVLKGLRLLKNNTNPNSGKPNSVPFVSVVIPFRNESSNILESLRCILNQKYPEDKYEVYYVNDSSTDDSLEKISAAEKSGNIKVISVPAGFYSSAHKKRAIRYALQFVKGEIIVSTDCDCFMGDEWLNCLLNRFDVNTAFVSGPVEFLEDPTPAAGLQRMEFAGLVLVGAGLIGAGSPTICNAANLAYRKSVFDEVGGFDDNIRLSSGDDEILMQKIAARTSYKIDFCMMKDAMVSTYPNKSVNEFFQQRKRWASKGLFYADKLLILKLFFIFLFYLSIPVQIVLAFLLGLPFVISLVFSLITKVCIEKKILEFGESELFGSGLLKNFALAEMLQIPYIIIAAVSGVKGNFQWKDRKLKR